MAKASQAKGKAKRWRKGQSSSSNPEIRKHRDAAKNRFFQTSTGPSQLTMSALEKHDADQADIKMDQDVDAQTFKTWATNITECTNTTFNKVHQNWSNDAVHKEVLAVLAAVTDIIRSQGGHESELEYFAILMTTIEATEEISTLSATVYLLNLVMKKLPTSVLKSKFSDVSKVFLSLLEKHVTKEGASMVSKIISCLTTVLRVQDRVTWSQPATLEVYTSLLAFTVHPKPKVRKSVRDAVTVILRASDFLTSNPDIIHPAASHTEKFCCGQIQKLLNSSLLQKNKDITHSSDIIHILQLYKNVISCFPHSSIKSACELVLKLMSLNNLVLKGICLEVLNSLFNSQPPAERLPADLNAKIITALYDFIPNVSDIHMMPAWLLVTENAHISLCRLDESLCLSHLPRFVSTCLKCFISERMENITAAAVTLKSVIIKCLGQMDASTLTEQLVQLDSPLIKVINSIEKTLGYQYHSSWSFALQVLATLFQHLGSTCKDVLSKILPSMSDLRDNAEFGYKAELDHAVGAAIKYMGPKCVMTVIPLQINASGDDIRRSWLMPLLVSHVCNTELAFFTQYFLPLASKSRDIALKQQAAGNLIQQKVHEALVHQIWSLLPAFCTKPTDLVQSFKSIAKTLGQAISDRPDLRKNVLSALRKLIHSCEDNDVYKAEMAKYAKNYLPILFNLYSDDSGEGESSDHQVVLDTVKDYLSITDQELVNSFFDKCMSRLVNGDGLSKTKRNYLSDLAISMVFYIDSNRIYQVCQHVAVILKDKDRTLQKKGYRFLENICSMRTATCSEFAANHLSDLQEMLLSNLSSSNPSSKGPRLRCLSYLFKILETENRDFMVAVLPEAILCTKEVGEAARKAAFDLLIAMCEANIQWKSDWSTNEAVMDFLSLVGAGLAGSPMMVHCTVLAIIRIVYEYKKDLTSNDKLVVMNHCCTLLKSQTREIVTPALSLLKVIIANFEVTDLAQHIQTICESLAHMREQNKHHLRFKVKEILDRLVRKFGYETISNLLPETYSKQLNNLKKTIEHKKKEVAEKRLKSKSTGNVGGGGDDDALLKSVKQSQPESVEEILASSDSELDDETKTENKSKAKKKGPAAIPAWLRDDKDEITDFLDTQAAKNIMAARPTVRQPNKPPTIPDFKTAADGRMVITEVDDEILDRQNHNDKGQAELEDIDDIFEQFEMQSGKRAKKRRFEMMSESASQISTSTYQPGGKGIHRPLDKKKRKSDDTWSQHTGSEFKSKKGSGDVKRNNKMDPYAYVPLNVNKLNRRKSAKLKGQFKNLVGGARKGAIKGMKNKKQKSKS